MISYNDPEFIDTKNIISGFKALSEFHKSIIGWIETKYNVPVLNIFEDRIIPDNRKRLNVIFWYEKEANKFNKHENVPFSNFDKNKQDAIEEAYWQILNAKQSTDFDKIHFLKKTLLRQPIKIKREKLFVCFCGFENVARQEAFSQVSDLQLQTIAINSSLKIWKVHKTYSYPIFFVEKNPDLESITDLEKNYIADELKAAMQPYDEYNFFKEKPLVASFDSKQNFDEVYNGNWFYYSRDH